MKTAMGMVAAMVKVPQGLPWSAFHHHQRHHGQHDHHDQQHRQQCGESTHLADLLAGHLAERLAVAPHRREQNDESCAAPPSTAPTTIQSAPGRLSELRGENGPDQRSRPAMAAK